MKLVSFCRERNMQFRGPTLRSLAGFYIEIARFYCSFSRDAFRWLLLVYGTASLTVELHVMGNVVFLTLKLYEIKFLWQR